MSANSTLKTFAAALPLLLGVSSSALAASGGPDGFGYTYIDSDEPAGPAYFFEDISVTGNVSTVSFCDDCRQDGINIGFGFPFYGINRTLMTIQSNGGISFPGLPSTLTFSNQCLPTTSGGNGAMIVPLWDDFNPSSGGTVYFETRGTAPNRRTIIQWDNVNKFFASPLATMQVVLHESGQIDMAYDDIRAPFINSSTVGIQPNSADALQYVCNAGGPHTTPTSGRFIQWNPPGCVDSDGDGFEDQSCGGLDCDDSNGNIRPGFDFDGDLLGDCEEVNGTLAPPTDPLNADTDGGGVPDGIEVLFDGTNPSDGLDDCSIDNDLDGVGQCEDCNDLDPSVFPGNPETCDGIDNDCDPSTNDGAAGPGDGYIQTDSGDAAGPIYRERVLLAPATLSLADDEVSAGIPLGFTFDFFGSPFSTVYVSSNGYLTFNADTGVGIGQSGCCTGQLIPSASNPDNLIAFWWEDLDPPEGGSIRHETRGAPGLREFVLEFRDIQHFPNGSEVTLQVVLFEQDSRVEIHYIDAVGDGGLHTVGLENAAGNDGYAFINRSVPSPQAGTAVRWTVPSGEVDADGDTFLVCEECDDGNANTFPGAPELCDRQDNDCDGIIPADETDDDVDGLTECEGDCDDGNAATFPGAPEICDREDNNCDGTIPADETDIDGDTFTACEGDCDEADNTEFPGAPEVCDGEDNDCDGIVPGDEIDDDGDGLEECNGDCNDADPLTFPGAFDGPCDAIDQDCDGTPTLPVDADGDGFDECADCNDGDPGINPAAYDIPCDGIDQDCTLGDSGGVDNDGDGVGQCGDCDNNDPNTFPGAPELCDGADNDCDGLVPLDEQDIDGDGVLACAGDCDDTVAATFPGASEICDGLDNDCDGTVPADESDDDADGFRICAGDCADANPAQFPGAVEACDLLDTDCDGVIPPSEIDADGDGFGICQGDCEDNDATRFPGQVEACNGVDDNCDGVVPPLEIDDDLDGLTECEGDCDDADPTLNQDDVDNDGFTTCDGDCVDTDPTIFPRRAGNL